MEKDNSSAKKALFGEYSSWFKEIVDRTPIFEFKPELPPQKPKTRQLAMLKISEHDLLKDRTLATYFETEEGPPIDGIGLARLLSCKYPTLPKDIVVDKVVTTLGRYILVVLKSKEFPMIPEGALTPVFNPETGLLINPETGSLLNPETGSSAGKDQSKPLEKKIARKPLVSI